jgi:hypothetical protein
MIARRRFLDGLLAVLAAPAIIRTPGLLMPVTKIMQPRLTGFPYRCPLCGGNHMGKCLGLLYDLLRPGLRNLAGSYAAFPAQWERIFALEATAA